MRIGRFQDATRKMAEGLYRAEGEAAYEEAQETTVSVKTSVAVSSLLNVLAERFEQSRYAFSGVVLQDFALDLLLSLDESDRDELSKKADEGTTVLLKKKGFNITSVGLDGSADEDQTWRLMVDMDKTNKLRDIEAQESEK